MMVYNSSLATPGSLTTAGTINTETEAFFLKAGTRNAYLQMIAMNGKANNLTALSGIVLRVIKWGTASTGGTGITPAPTDPGMQAAKATAASRPTSGTTRTNRFITGCGVSTPGGWVAPNPETYEVLEGGGAPSISMMDVSGALSLNYEASFSHRE